MLSFGCIRRHMLDVPVALAWIGLMMTIIVLLVCVRLTIGYRR